MRATQQPWVDGQTFGQALARTVQNHSDREALVFPALNFRQSYGAFAAEVRTLARALIASGVQPGETLGIWATNWPQWVHTQFASAACGAVLVNLNPAYRAHELAFVLNHAKISTLLLTDRFKTSHYFELFTGLCPELAKATPGELHAEACPHLRRVVSIKTEKVPGMWNWEEFRALAARVSEAELDRRTAQAKPEDVVNIQYTSGTTGFPKGAMLTHRNLLLNAFYVGQRQAMSNADRLCIPVPFYHCFGCVMGTLMCSLYGAAMVIPAEVFDPEATLKAVRDERCTALYGVPTMFIAQLQHPRFAEYRSASLRTGIMAGSPCPIQVMREVVEKMGAREVTIAYGLTEASPVITQTEITDSIEHRVGTVGKPLPGVEVRIVTPGTLEPLPPGQPGELMARSHGVMKGYIHQPEATAQAITADGWLHTGDLAMQTPDGYYRITGRIKDMIIRGGENIYPREIEEFLYTHEGIADVQVVGLPSDKFGEEVSAWIRLKPGVELTVEEILKFCRDRIAHFKVPRHVFFIDSFPTTVTGKIQKFKLRELGIEKLSLQKAAATETA